MMTICKKKEKYLLASEKRKPRPVWIKIIVTIARHSRQTVFIIIITSVSRLWSDPSESDYDDIIQMSEINLII